MFLKCKTYYSLENNCCDLTSSFFHFSGKPCLWTLDEHDFEYQLKVSCNDT